MAGLELMLIVSDWCCRHDGAIGNRLVLTAFRRFQLYLDDISTSISIYIYIYIYI